MTAILPAAGPGRQPPPARRRRTGWVLLATTLAAATITHPAITHPAITDVPAGGDGPAGTPGAAPATRCAPVEERLDGIPEVANPFDPGQADVSVEVRGPGGRAWRVPAFATQDFERSLGPAGESRAPRGPLRWAARITPTAPGSWRWRSVVTRPAGAAAGAWAPLPCVPDPASHGVLRVAADRRYLVWEDGTPFFGVGENVAWPDQRGTFAYDAWLGELARHGATMVRVWMADWAMALEGTATDGRGRPTRVLGDYRARLDRAWQLDHVIETARRLGLVVVLSLQAHGTLSTRSDPRWDQNPYNRALGGPAATPADFFTDQAARDLFRRRLRYLVARWSHAPNLIWELLNEADLVEADLVGPVARWHAEMADELHRLDPAHHLVTTSLTGLGVQTFWPEVPQLDLVQVHPYGDGVAHPIDFTRTMIPLMSILPDLHDRPVVVGETGVDWHGPDQTLAIDPDYQGLHEGIWSPLFAGAASAGLPWWWDSRIERDGRYDLFEGIAALTRGVRLDGQRFAADGAEARAPGRRLQALPLRGRTTALVWVRVAGDWWRRPDPAPVHDARLEVTQLPLGHWRVRLVDPRTGGITDRGRVRVNIGAATVRLPDFAHDVAVRLDWEAPL